jgi:hypothetical protein
MGSQKWFTITLMPPLGALAIWQQLPVMFA